VNTARTATLVPLPVSMKTLDAPPFTLAATSRIAVAGDGGDSVAERLAGWLRSLTGFALPVTSEAAQTGDIAVILADGEAPAGHAGEGYILAVDDTSIRIGADTAAGLFWGTQSLRQLVGATGGVWSVPAVDIVDYPRYAYRGVMLDVVRHFFGVEDVKRYLDELAGLKINHLHLHLTDDQGWRIEITSWPDLTAIGGGTQVGGGAGGFYTQEQYRAIVAYAASLHITIVPEIDMPGHTNAALASYPELTADGIARQLYTGTDVGFSSLVAGKDVTYRFIDDVIREVAALTPGPYIHLGGDESLATTPEDFLAFVERATAVAAQHGKTLIGWQEMGRCTSLPTGTIGQFWDFVTPRAKTAREITSFVDQGGAVIMSPSDVAYLDIKYAPDAELGLLWADGPTNVRDSYSWDPESIVPGISGASVLGVEAALWTETITSLADIHLMTFPRLAAIAEIAWSAAPEASGGRDFDAFALRLAVLGELWDAAGIAYYADPDIPWRRPA
jgi:hexosaminidase